MEVNIHTLKYILPLDSIDFNLLSHRSQYSAAANSTVPLWRADRRTTDEEYYEFEVYAEPLVNDGLDCKENKKKQPCYICNVDVPTAFFKQHLSSDKHKMCLKITDTSMDRLKKHMAVETSCDLVEKADEDTYLCESCTEAVKVMNKTQHEKTKPHKMSVHYDKLIRDLVTAYTDQQTFIKEYDIIDDSNNTVASMGLPIDPSVKNTPTGEPILKNDPEGYGNHCDNLKSGRRSSIFFEQKTENDNAESSLDRAVVKNDHEEEVNKKCDDSKSGAPSTNNSEQQNEGDQPKMSLHSYFKLIYLNNVTLTPYYGAYEGVTLTLPNGTQVRVPIDNFHGFHRFGGFTHCRLCRCTVDSEARHMVLLDHMDKIQAPLKDMHCVRQLDSIWSHCVLCNEYLESVEVHIASANHVASLNQAVIQIQQAVSVKLKKAAVPIPTFPTNTPKTKFCKHCNINLPSGKEGKSTRKAHNKSAEHKHNQWLAVKDIKIHHHLLKTSSQDEVWCRVCDVAVPYTKEGLDFHISSADHGAKYKVLLVENFITKTDDMLLNCDACNKSLFFFDEIKHIGKKAHRNKVIIKRYQDTQPNNPSQVSPEDEGRSENKDATVKTVTFAEKLKQKAQPSQPSTSTVAAQLKHPPSGPVKEFPQNAAIADNTDQKTAFSNFCTEAIKAQENVTPMSMSSNYAHWLGVHKFTSRPYFENQYHCGACQTYIMKPALFDHSNTESHKGNLSKNSFHYCEDCKIYVLNTKFHIDEHEKCYKHLRNQVQSWVPQPQTQKPERSEHSEPQLKQSKYCQYCKTAVTAGNEKLHLISVGHRKKMAESLEEEKRKAAAALVESKTDKPAFAATLRNIDTKMIANSVNAPSTSKVAGAVNSTNPVVQGGANKANSDSTAPNTIIGVDLIVRQDNKVYCRLCQVEIPDTKVNITDHLTGRRHATNFESKMTENKLIKRNGHFFCEVCSLNVLKEHGIKHILSVVHKNGLLSAPLTQKPVSIPVPIMVSNVQINTEQNTSETIVTNPMNTIDTDGTNPVMTADVKGTNNNPNTPSEMTSSFCNICNVRVPNYAPAKKAHYESPSHKNNLTKAFNTASQIKPLQSGNICVENPHDYVKTVGDGLAKKLVCQICKRKVKPTKIIGHLAQKSHVIHRVFFDKLKSHQMVILENETYECRLCNTSCCGKWRSEMHMLGEAHLNLLEKHMENTTEKTDNVSTIQKATRETFQPAFSVSMNDENDFEANSSEAAGLIVRRVEEEDKAEKVSMIKKTSNEKCDPADDFLTSIVVDKEQSIVKEPEPFESDTSEEATTSEIQNEEDETLSSTSVVDNWFEISDDQDGILFLDDAETKVEDITDCSKETESHEQNTIPIKDESAKKDGVQDCLEKSEKGGVFCKYCEVSVPAHEHNVEEHINGATHKKRQLSHLKQSRDIFMKKTANPKIEICEVCSTTIPYDHIDIHLAGLRHTNQFEVLLSMHKIVKKRNSYICEVCIQRLDAANLIKHVESAKHKENLNNLPGTSKDITTSKDTTSSIPATDHQKNKFPLENKNQNAGGLNKITIDPKATENIARPEREVFCKYCDVLVVPANDSNIAEHINGAVHKKRQESYLKQTREIFMKKTANTKSEMCTVCSKSIPYQHIVIHLAGAKHRKLFELLLSTNKIVMKLDSYMCEVCTQPLAAANLANLVSHIESAKHKLRLGNVPGTSKDTAANAIVTDHQKNLPGTSKDTTSSTVKNKLHKNVLAFENGNQHAGGLKNKIVTDPGSTDLQAGYCEVCKQKCVISWIFHLKHTHEIQEISNSSYYCQACDCSLDNCYAHISTESHKMNATTITYVGPAKSTSPTENNGAEKNEEKPLGVGEKMFKTIQGVCEKKTSQLLCAVCKTIVDKNLEQFNAHFNSKTHVFMFDAALSANGIEDKPGDNFFCNLCRINLPPQYLFDHIQALHHQTNLVDGLKRIGKTVFSVQASKYGRYTMFVDGRMLKSARMHFVASLAKSATLEPHFCDICQVALPELLLNRLSHETNDPQHVLKFSSILKKNMVVYNKNDCFCKPCNKHFTKQTAIAHVESMAHWAQFCIAFDTT